MEIWSYSWEIRNLTAELMMPPGIWVLWVLLMLFYLKSMSLLKKC
jgi:hypothetical protein